MFYSLTEGFQVMIDMPPDQEFFGLFLMHSYDMLSKEYSSWNMDNMCFIVFPGLRLWLGVFQFTLYPLSQNILLNYKFRKHKKQNKSRSRKCQTNLISIYGTNILFTKFLKKQGKTLQYGPISEHELAMSN